ncbi:hypothetical protein A7981_01600 [Methylovorus sp. MM2]|uniref:phosphatase PAP2 family protein n=1 Tax=Methylovorus sp. MM2 TaxID=1848038 RepID=UPI0007DFD14F|nr:phosphatase PAP2 family protein [Methylovorus sp. MM2]OAM52211.1 hypothetical protein A7981_01600 [Methylovorus sp. MM2]
MTPHNLNKQTSLIYKVLILSLLILAPIFLFIGTYTDIDIAIEDYYYDPVLHQFPWGDAWLTTAFAHGALKTFFVDFGVIVLAIVIIDFLFPIKRMADFLRYRLRLIALASVVLPIIIRSLKKHSALHCPWDVDRYGGYAPYLRILDHVPANWHAGNCFPTGHASTGLWLASLAVLWLPHSPKKALAVFIAGLSIGFGLGWTQSMRGAHFFTHTLWAIWVTIFVMLILFWLFSKKLMQQMDPKKIPI